MDAFSVSVANGLREPDMGAYRRLLIAGTYAVFQIAMPVIGWICVSRALDVFTSLQRFIPYVALAVLFTLGSKMIAESIRQREDSFEKPAVGGTELVMQGIATSIDALSVGFAFALYDTLYVLPAAFIIGMVTFIICLIGLAIGRVVGMRFTRYSGTAGGLILIFIGMSIFVRS
ncbi:MAG: manganese efflux pump [Lachnospiraceae bacterium]|nr:manganese efflux pump [Lachnospiraceae bacterium]